LYCKYEYFDLAADVLAENAHLTYKYMTPYLYDFIEAKIVHQTSPIEAYRKFDTISSKHTELLRKYTKQVQEARANNEEETIKKHINDYEVILSQLIIKKASVYLL
jgi:tetratricopeptide repeat protein 30